MNGAGHTFPFDNEAHFQPKPQSIAVVQVRQLSQLHHPNVVKQNIVGWKCCLNQLRMYQAWGGGFQ